MTEKPRDSQSEPAGEPLPAVVESGAVDADDPAPPETEPARDTATSKWPPAWIGSALAAAAISVVIVLALAYLIGPALVVDRMPAPETVSDPRLDVLEERLAALETAAARMDGLDGGVQALGQRLDGIEGTRGTVTRRLGAIENRLAALDTALLAAEAEPTVDTEAVAALARAQGATQDRITAVGADVERLGAEIARLRNLRDLHGNGALLLLAAWRLGEAARGPDPFTRELDLLAAAAGGDAEMTAAAEALAPLAAGGTPAADSLRDRFAALVPALIRADAMARAGDSWVDQTVARMRQMITVRREGADTTGADAGAVVSRTEAALARGDLAAAVAEVASLDAVDDPEVAAWLAQSGDRVAIMDGLGAITARAVALLDDTVAAP